MTGAWFYYVIDFKDRAAKFERFVNNFPITPSPGMEISFDADAECNSETIRSASYCVPDDVWWIDFETWDRAEDDCQCEPKDGCCHYNQGTIDWMTEMGWTFVEATERVSTKKPPTPTD